MKRLSGRHELLDGPLDTDLLRDNLRDLIRINRWLGGARLSLQAVAPFVVGRKPGEPLHLLDVGTGAADIPLVLFRSAGSRRHNGVQISAIDIRPEIVELAAINVRGTPIEVRHGQLDGEAAKAFDVVHLSLVMHHLDPPAALSMLREARRVARESVVVNDLERGWRWFVGAWLMTRLLARNAYTRSDAPLSVRRAYTASEMADMGRQAGLRPVALYRMRPAYRYALVLVADEAAR